MGVLGRLPSKVGEGGAAPASVVAEQHLRWSSGLRRLGKVKEDFAATTFGLGGF